MRRAALCAVAAALACGGEEDRKPAPAPVEETAPPPSEVATAPATLTPETLPPDTAESSLLEHAVPAWQAVLERGSLLARRGQRGAAYGRVAMIGDTTWLIDETAAARGLGIRIAGAGAARLELTAGHRVLAFGAWEAVDRRWVWKVERLVALRSTDGKTVAPAAAPLPGTLMTSGAAPDGARVFWVVAAPVKAGDGWTIADEKDGPPVATLLLPGEMLGAPYGGLDYLAPEERWTLARGKPYAAPVTEVQLRRKLSLPVLRASAPPVAVAAE